MASQPQRPIPAAAFGRNFGRYRDKAIEEGVVEITSNGRPVGAYLSQKQYEQFQRLVHSSKASNGEPTE